MMKETLYHTLTKPAYTGEVQLSWEGKYSPTKVAQYPAVCIQQSKSLQNLLFWGDNFHALAHLLDGYRGKIDLIYLDPPFDSQANYDRIVRPRGAKTNKQHRITQYTDQWSPSQYLQFMHERLLLLRDLLSQTGSIYIHADWHRISHLRLLMDDIFGAKNLLNEIIWHHDFGGRSPYFLARKHDNLLLYKKGNDWTFNQNALPDIAYKGTLHTYRGSTKTGKKPTAVWNDLQPSQDFVWDIAYENKMAKQNTGYPTQKPLELLNRIITLSSNEGDLVLDPFLGSGSTALAAIQTQRQFIGIDDNWDSIHTTRTRICHLDCKPDLSIYSTNRFFVFRSPLAAKALYPSIIQPNNIVEKRDLYHLDQSKPPAQLTAHQYSDSATEYLQQYFPQSQCSLLQKVSNDLEISWEREGNQLYIIALSSKELYQRLQITSKEQKSFDWRCFVQSIVIDFNYNGQYLRSPLIDSPLDRATWVQGQYLIPKEHQNLLVIVTDIECREWRISLSKEELWSA